jgi:hypothetical protein
MNELRSKISVYRKIVLFRASLTVGCAHWGEGKDRQYSTLTVRFPWETCKKTLYSHRFSYMIFNRVFDLSKDIHVSHICHQRRCINPAHLSYEPNHVNQDRQVCRGIVPAQCEAHQPFPDCLL